MRTIDSSISVLKPSNIAWWHTSWTGRFILAALLIAAAAFVLTPGRTSAQTTLRWTRNARDQLLERTNIPWYQTMACVADATALVAIANSLGEDSTVGIDITG